MVLPYFKSMSVVYFPFLMCNWHLFKLWHSLQKKEKKKGGLNSLYQFHIIYCNKCSQNKSYIDKKKKNIILHLVSCYTSIKNIVYFIGYCFSLVQIDIGAPISVSVSNVVADIDYCRPQGHTRMIFPAKLVQLLTKYLPLMLTGQIW